MPDFEILFAIALGLGLGLTALVLWTALAGGGSTSAADAISEGRFAEALAEADDSDDAERDDLWAAAVAAKHLGEWDVAEERLRRILDEDDDGEAWLEMGLLHAYRGRFDDAEACFRRVAAQRADLLESLTLHRAWVALRRGDRATARRLFDEVEATLETKLRTDMGSGEPLFLEWLLQCSELWAALGSQERAQWSRAEAQRAAGDSRLPSLMEPTA